MKFSRLVVTVTAVTWTIGWLLNESLAGADQVLSLSTPVGMVRAPGSKPGDFVDAPLIDLNQLDATLDLWMCMWEDDEREAFETALVRSMTDQHPKSRRLLALAACHVIATPRLLAAAARVAEADLFAVDETAWIEQATLSRHNMLKSAARMRGNVLGVELLLARVVSGAHDPPASTLLEWIDVRDLIAVARTTIAARLFAEVERRISRRGKYQRGRAANLLGFTVRTPSNPAVPSLAGEWGSHSPEIGDFKRQAS